MSPFFEKFHLLNIFSKINLAEINCNKNFSFPLVKTVILSNQLKIRKFEFWGTKGNRFEEFSWPNKCNFGKTPKTEGNQAEMIEGSFFGIGQRAFNHCS